MNILSALDYESAAEATDNDVSFEGEKTERENVFIFPNNLLSLQGALPGPQPGFVIYWRISTSRRTPEILRQLWSVSSYRSAARESCYPSLGYIIDCKHL